jgi:hypothetical protein
VLEIENARERKIERQVEPERGKEAQEAAEVVVDELPARRPAIVELQIIVRPRQLFDQPAERIDLDDRQRRRHLEHVGVLAPDAVPALRLHVALFVDGAHLHRLDRRVLAELHHPRHVAERVLSVSLALDRREAVIDLRIGPEPLRPEPIERAP